MLLSALQGVAQIQPQVADAPGLHPNAAGFAGADPAQAMAPAPVDPGLRRDPAEGQRSMPGTDDAQAELRRLRALDKGPRRFAADLFDFNQREAGVTEGGIADDYVLGVGDHLHMGLFGSITFEVPLVVDGRGTIVVPRVGTVAVAGMTLARARSAVEAKVRQVFSRAVVDLSVTKLREVRVFVLGEVYRPGGYLVPNLGSIINVLGLAGGPTHAGSFRRIRLIRGGETVRTVDLYPLRSQGVGNINLGFQNGDTVFVPLLENQVRLEGAFTRVVAAAPDGQDTLPPPDTEEQKDLKRQIRRLELTLGLPSSTGEPGEAGQLQAQSGRPAPAGQARGPGRRQGRHARAPCAGPAQARRPDAGSRTAGAPGGSPGLPQRAAAREQVQGQGRQADPQGRGDRRGFGAAGLGPAVAEGGRRPGHAL